MKRSLILATGAFLTVLAHAGGTVTFSLSSPSNGAVVSAGDPIEWTITVSVSTGDNLGLALAAVNLVQDAGNLAFCELPAGETPLDMTDFDRPDGISNPGPGGVGSAYGGTPMGTTGHKDLIQIGGAQNTFGVAGNEIGLDYDVRGGVGQSGPQILATGSFLAPATEGLYALNLASPLANTLDGIAVPPAFSPISGAAAAIDNGQITFTVSELAVCIGDMNCDGTINFGDINPFVKYLTSFGAWQTQYSGCSPLTGDINCDGTYGQASFGDINPFVAVVVQCAAGCDCPGPVICP
jgi:hypothetical protein